MNITAKIIIFLITSGIICAVSVFFFGFMILGMNGFHESDANYGIYLYIIWALIGSIVSGILSVVITSLLAEKMQIHIAVAGLISIIVFIIAGLIFNFIGVFAGFIIADFVRTRH